MHKFKLKSHFNEWATWLDLNYITYGLETLMKMNLSQVQQKQLGNFPLVNLNILPIFNNKPSHVH